MPTALVSRKSQRGPKSNPYFAYVSVKTVDGEMKLAVPQNFVDHFVNCHLAGTSLHQALGTLMVCLQRNEIDLYDFDYWVRAALAAFPE